MDVYHQRLVEKKEKRPKRAERVLVRNAEREISVHHGGVGMKSTLLIMKLVMFQSTLLI